MAPVLRALRTLNARDQDVLTLVDWSGLTYPEAAVALGIPVGTVRSRLARARDRLTRALDRTDTTVDRIDTDPHPRDWEIDRLDTRIRRPGKEKRTR
jgi:RNA polymerase sigma-70 factor (ECF subfamily)